MLKNSPAAPKCALTTKSAFDNWIPIVSAHFMFPYAALRPNQVHNPSFSLIKLSKSEYLSIYQSYQFGVGVCGSGVRRYGLERGVFRENPRPPCFACHHAWRSGLFSADTNAGTVEPVWVLRQRRRFYNLIIFSIMVDTVFFP